MADFIGEKRSSYAEWERSTMPRADILSKISSILKVQVKDLMGGAIQIFGSSSELPESVSGISFNEDPAPYGNEGRDILEMKLPAEDKILLLVERLGIMAARLEDERKLGALKDKLIEQLEARLKELKSTS